MIHIASLTKKYGDFTALNNVSFEVSKGEVFGLLGPNGAGKTTMMKILTTFMTSTDGKVVIDGLDASGENNLVAIRRKIGYLPENNPLYPEMRVKEYLQFVAELKSQESVKFMKSKVKDVIDEEIEKVIKTCGLIGRENQLIGEFSKGLKQRVGLAAALLGKPEILILDEPTNGLDPNQIVEIRNLIKEIGQEKTVILSTHILSEVKATCDKVVIINRGSIVAQGSVDELIQHAAGNEIVEVLLKGDSKAKIKEGLASIANVLKVEELQDKDGAHLFKVEAPAGVDLRESIFRAACDNRWVVLETQKKSLSLEDVFRELTK